MLLGFLPAVLPLAAQPPQPEATFRTETRLALVRFHAVQKNRYVDTLTQDDVQLLEDGKPRKIAVFEGPGTPDRAERGPQKKTVDIPALLMLVF